MIITKTESCSLLGWTSFVLLGLTPCSAIAKNLADEAPTNEILEDNRPACPEEPFFHFSDEEVAETGLSRELLCVVADTALFRHDPPGPDESPDLLRRVLRRGPYKDLNNEQYQAVMEEAVRLWPKSHYAHEGLAEAILGAHSSRYNTADKRRAVDEFLQAADLAFDQGKVLDLIELPQLLAMLGDKENLTRYFKRVFELLPDGEGRYASYLAYAEALATLGDEQAERYFKKAIAVSSKGGLEDAYWRYTRYLLEHQKAQAVLDILTPGLTARHVMSEDIFHTLRCQALEQLGRGPEAAQECQQARDLVPPARRLPSPASQPGSGASALDPLAPSGPGLLARLLGIGLAQGVHDNILDDCRSNFACEFYPGDDWNACYYFITWNLAELIENEAGGETFGSRADVAWTVRDRVNRGVVPNPGCSFPGTSGTCAPGCANPEFCELQKKICCVIHSGAFVDRHKSSTTLAADVTLPNLHLAADIITGNTPEPTSSFIPSGASGCITNVCGESLHCSVGGDDYQYAPEGPIYFYANYATSYTCKGFQPGVDSRCTVVAKETCGDSTNGVGSDNCYARATRNRAWTSGSHFAGSAGVTTLSTTIKQLPPGAYIYRDDNFKSPGGKEFVVSARVKTTGTSARFRVQLKNSSSAVVHDFGTQQASTVTFVDRKFTSTSVVLPVASQVIIINEGPGILQVNTVQGRD